MNVSEKQETSEASNSLLQNDSVVMEFLNAQKRTTFFTYKSQIKLYLEFAKKSGKQLIEEKKNDKDFQVENSIFQFRKWLLENGRAETYATSAIGCLRGFYAYYRIPLMFRRQESKKLTEKNRKTVDYLFDKEDLTKMALAGNLKERYVLLVGKSVGLRASDFLTLTYGCFRSLKLDSDAPIGLGEISTQKERIKAFPFLDSDAIPIVKQWLESNKEAKDSNRMIDDVEENLSVILQTLCKKAGMEIDNAMIHGKRVRFHCLRKFLIDRLSAYASESQWKQIVGKSIEEGAYVSQDQLRGVFQRAMKDLTINGNGIKTKKLMELENALKMVESENSGLKTRVNELQQTIKDLQTQTTNGDASLNTKVDLLEGKLLAYKMTIEEIAKKVGIKASADQIIESLDEEAERHENEPEGYGPED